MLRILTGMRVAVHLCQRMAERQHRTLRRPDDVEQFVVVVVHHHVLPRLGVQVAGRSGAGHVRRIQFVRVGAALRHQRLATAAMRMGEQDKCMVSDVYDGEFVYE